MTLTMAEQEAVAALRAAVINVHVALQAVEASEYGSEVRAACAEALRSISYALEVAEGRT